MATNFLLKRSGTASKRPEAASMALGELDLNYDASTGGIFYKDSAGGVVKVGPAQVGSTAPNASPAGSAGNSVGEFWYDTGASALKIWNGSVWVATGGGGGGSGTVTSITAGTGLSGGTITTSGTISLNTACVIQPTILTAKGSLISASAASTPVALGVGTSGQVLTACSTCASGLTWAAAGGGGCGSPATPTVSGVVYGITDFSESVTALGFEALGGGTRPERTTAIGGYALWNVPPFCTSNTAVGFESACQYAGSGSVIIGSVQCLPLGDANGQLAIGRSTANLWISGNSTNAIKPGAGIIDCANSCGSVGQILSSTGTNAIQWQSFPTGATGTFTFQEGCTITVTNGLITSIV